MLLIDAFGQAAFGAIHNRFRLATLPRQIVEFTSRLVSKHFTCFELDERLETSVDGAMGQASCNRRTWMIKSLPSVNRY